MASPNWRVLRVEVNDRAAIFAEAFPGVLAAAGSEVVAWFTHEEAQRTLFTFAGAWPTLGRDVGDPSTRYLYMAVGATVCRFRGVELAPGAIVVDDIAPL